MRPSTVLRQIRASPAFGTFDHGSLVIVRTKFGLVGLAVFLVKAYGGR